MKTIAIILIIVAGYSLAGTQGTPLTEAKLGIAYQSPCTCDTCCEHFEATGAVYNHDND